MAGSNIRAGGAFVEIFGKDMLDKSLKAAAVKLKAFGATATKMGAAMTTAGLAAAAPFAAMTGQFASAGAALGKLAAQTGASVEELSRLQYAAKRLGIDPDDLTGAIEELNIRIGETMRDGIGPAAEAFQQLGLDAEQLSRMPLPERLGAISDALARISDQSTRGFLADEIFGGDAFKLLPLIRQGADGIRELTEEADRLGATMSTEQVAAAMKFQKAWQAVTTAIDSTKTQIGTALAPAITELMNRIAGVVQVARVWLEQNRQAIIITAQVIAGTIAAGAALTTLGVAITGVGAILASVPAMVATAVAAFLAFTETGRQLAGNLLAVFKGVGRQIAEVFGIVSDLIMAGDITQATEVLWASIKAVFAEGKYAVVETWVGLQEILLSTWTNTVATVAGVLTKAWAGIKGIFYELRGLIDSSFDVDAAQDKLVQDTRAALAIIEQGRKSTNEARRQRLLAELKAAQEEAAAARAEKATAIDEARRKLEELELEGPPDLELPDASGLSGAASQAKRAAEGTFLSAAATRLGGEQNIERQQVELLEEAVDELARTRRAIEENPMAFA